MNIPTNSASQLAIQGIQTGFQKLSENSQNIASSLKTEEKLTSQSTSTSLETSLIDNQQLSTQIQSLAKVIKTEDGLIGQLLDNWA
ncbi:hypothetical protein [Thiomicrorhabdus arctica]|jgi:hypothetical protein|uniref:hypothetical protein n=1 Tax=Thiomicrorhabdus arctica TaxID=131540 RepID=UPI00036BCA2A|nr:hypothetical protein [Thiomicrorhabdus arctica]